MRGALSAGLGLLLALVLLPAAPARADRTPQPILRGDFADPAVEPYRRGYVGFATGDRVPVALTRTRNGTWRRNGPALADLPGWARAGDVWAADVRRVGGWWVLWFSAPVEGLGPYGRCIGVARSRSPLRGFVPVGDAPLVCPSYAGTPPAQDPLLPRDPTLPRAGVIDPSVHAGSDGMVLLYKTDRVPSSIRMVPLSRNGTRVRTGTASLELLRSTGVVENPLLVARPQGWVLMLSEGDFTRCTYRTIWLRSATLTGLATGETGVLMDRATTGLCGPAGADLAGNRLFLHGWNCQRRRKRPDRPCHAGFDWSEKERLRAERALYAVRLRWEGGLPRLAGWMKP